jgi:hypothetical protein
MIFPESKFNPTITTTRDWATCDKVRIATLFYWGDNKIKLFRKDMDVQN